jgi:hypothetical protein
VATAAADSTAFGLLGCGGLGRIFHAELLAAGEGQGTEGQEQGQSHGQDGLEDGIR